ncbi:isoprenylcysteine carboxylmethyltransferase family protein [bacterium]|nr:isoprenylcysteine carboxylmethyltransferase family protein [bacterium]
MNSWSRVELLRKNVSRVGALAWFVGAGATVPSLGFDGYTARTLFALGGILTVVGATGRTWCLLAIAGRKDQELLTIGPYSMCRNPLYLFSLIGTVGIGLASRTFSAPLIALTAFLLYYVGVIRSEQRRLRELYGEEFDAYQSRVNALWPAFKSYKPLGETREVYVRPFVRGLVDNGWFFVGFIGLQVLGELREQGLFFNWLTLP